MATTTKAPSRPVHLLIDGDVLAFVAAAAAQYIYESPDGFVYPVGHKPEGEAVLENLLHRITMVDFPGSTFTVVLSDPKENWRKSVWPDYKANRKDARRPLMLDYLKDYLREKYGAFHWDGLEADDVLGILMTAAAGDDCFFPVHRQAEDAPDPEYAVIRATHDRIIVGRDKDFLTVPGKYHRIKDYDYREKPVVTESTPWMAKRWHMIQTLAGDRVDGYPGCKNIGMARAEEIIDGRMLLRPSVGVITRGVNKGQAVTKWVAEPSTDFWAIIVSNYEKAGLTEEDALTAARLAHILTWEDYRDGEITLWTPDKLKDVHHG